MVSRDSACASSGAYVSTVAAVLGDSVGIWELCWGIEERIA